MNGTQGHLNYLFCRWWEIVIYLLRLFLCNMPDNGINHKKKMRCIRNALKYNK